MKIPAMKESMVKEAKKQIREIEKQAKLGLITESERYNKIIDIWTKVTDKVADIMFDAMKEDEKLFRIRSSNQNTHHYHKVDNSLLENVFFCLESSNAEDNQRGFRLIRGKFTSPTAIEELLERNILDTIISLLRKAYQSKNVDTQTTILMLLSNLCLITISP